jgi:integrase/recombinase XerD
MHCRGYYEEACKLFLLAASTLKGRRDRAILAVLLLHALRRQELTKLCIKDFPQERRSVPRLRMQGKGDKLRFIPTHPSALRLVAEYLAAGMAGRHVTPTS